MYSVHVYSTIVFGRCQMVTAREPIIPTRSFPAPHPMLVWRWWFAPSCFHEQQVPSLGFLGFRSSLLGFFPSFLGIYYAGASSVDSQRPAPHHSRVLCVRLLTVVLAVEILVVVVVFVIVVVLVMIVVTVVVV